jgi:hypothetical protein
VVATRPHVRARAVVGVPGIAKMAFEIIAKLATSPMARFDDLEEAKDWLVSHR